MADAARAISRSYTNLGYERVKKAPAGGGKHVVLWASAGQSYVSVYDSDNAALDCGELKDMALGASKALKTAAVFTSLNDSDTFEFIVFANGRQVDLLMTGAEDYDGPMKQLSGKSRAAKWSSLFGRTLSIDQIENAVTQPTVFADNVIAGLSALIGLGDRQPQVSYQDFLNKEEEITAELHFKRKPKALSEIPAGEIRLGDYFDPDNCRMRSVYPASWPIQIGSKRLPTWLILSQGAGFSGGTASIRLSGPDTLSLSRAIISGCKFHNGQIVGPLEPVAPNLTQEDVAKLVDLKRFTLTQVEPSSAEARVYTGNFPNLAVPSMTPDRTTQILLILQMDLEPQAAGEWEIKVCIQPGMQSGYHRHLPPLRAAAVEQKWIPVVSGLNSRTRYDKSNLGANHLRELEYRQSQAPGQRQLDHPAVTGSVAILNDEGQPTLDACRSWLEAWLGPLAEQQDGEIRILAEKQMSASAYVGRTKKTLPVSGFLRDKIWAKLFECSNDYQTVLVSFVPQNAECAVAGIGLQRSLVERRTGGQHLADALSAMRGKTFDPLEPGGTWHVFKWVTNHPDCYRYLETSAVEMARQLDRFAAEREPLQAFSSQCAWIPLFDQANSYERTAYEDVSVLNWFRGVNNDGGLDQDKMTAQWCRNVLRMVTPHLWLCRNLIEQVNRAALERVAEVTEAGAVYRIALRPGCAMDELEVALLPILPVESVRISVV